MNTKVKAVNYTDEQTTEAVATYVANPTQETVEALAAAFGKSTRSVVAKLSREGVYKAKAKGVTKTGEPVVTKAELVAQIAERVGVDEEAIGSLESATKAALQAVLSALPAVE